jgi:uncharacterized OB-fold protein
MGRLSKLDIENKSEKARRIIKSFWTHERPDRWLWKYKCPKCGTELHPKKFSCVEENGWTPDSGIEWSKNHYRYFSCDCGYEYGDIR